METIEILTSAIKQKRQISYEYNSPGRATGIRIGRQWLTGICPYTYFSVVEMNIA